MNNHLTKLKNVKNSKINENCNKLKSNRRAFTNIQSDRNEAEMMT